MVNQASTQDVGQQEHGTPGQASIGHTKKSRGKLWPGPPDMPIATLEGRGKVKVRDGRNMPHLGSCASPGESPRASNRALFRMAVGEQKRKPPAWEFASAAS